MYYKASIDTVRGSKAGHPSTLLTNQEREKEDKGLTSLKKGQRITGTVIAVDRQVTLAFGEQRIQASKEVIKNAVPGERKDFEVVKTTGNEIELRLLEGEPGEKKRSFKAVMLQAKDRELLINKKEQASKKEEKNKLYQDTKNRLEEISTKLTNQDYGKLMEQGFPVETMTISGLYGAINRVKEDGSQAYSNYNTPDNQEAGTRNNTISAERVTQRLTEENLPATEENVSRVIKALELSSKVIELDDKAMKYLISQAAKPTIENIYKAYYSGNTLKQEQPVGLPEEAWRELESQVKEVITAAGYEIDGKNLATARWLIENQLPLTEETLTYKTELEEIKASADPEMVLNKIMMSIKEGILPKDTSLSVQESTGYQKILNHISSIDGETITAAVREDVGLTINRLVTVQEALANGKYFEGKDFPVTAMTDKDGVSQTEEAVIPSESKDQTAATAEKDYRYEEIKARRQLEEIRLKMTLEAAAKLESRGFRIETRGLEEVVDALRDLENSYYKELLTEADAGTEELSVHILKETTQSIELLKQVPSYILGSTLSERHTQTIPGLLAQGNKLQAELDKAGAAYETLMTVPNREYGDSIRKAFANMDSLLTELNIENTEQNQRAVRILAYNRMEITQEAVTQVKAYDLEVNTLMEKLHPAVTVRMIKEKINPLELPISELNDLVDRMREEQGISSEEKFSTYLRQLEKNDAISQEERKAYIGIYRLLYNVEKTDGAALGAVINSGREVTLEHLLSAVRTQKKGRLDAVIDDEFGALQEVNRKGESISEQLSTFRGETSEQQEGQASGQDNLAEQTRYIDRVLKQMKEELTPERLQEMSHNSAQSAGTATLAAATPLLSSERGIWETVKDIPVEKLLEQLKRMEAENTASEAEYTAKVQEIRDLCKNSEQSIRFLNDFKVPSTPLNIILTNHLLSNGESAIRRLIKQKNENVVENSENTIKELSELSDTLIDKQSVQKIYQQLETDAKTALSMACTEEKIDSKRLAELKSIGQQMTFLRTLAEKEYYQIPIETKGGITNLNLTILRNSETAGKVTVTMQSEKLGNIKAELTLKDRDMKGYISCDNKNGLAKLQMNTAEIEDAAKEKDITIRQMDFVLQIRGSDTYFYQNPEREEHNSSMKADTERTLYRLAKAIVQTVRLAEREA